jgi:hypothetical protein
VDGRAKWDRATGLHWQLQPSGLGARVQYEATSPWRVTPKGKSRRNSQGDHNNQALDKLLNSDNKAQVSSVPPLISLSISTTHRDEREMGTAQGKSTVLHPPKVKRLTATDQRKMSCEWRSYETTSTMRCQSVKDLFYYYGIQRPAGLVSSENFAFNPELSPRPLVK